MQQTHKDNTLGMQAATETEGTKADLLQQSPGFRQ